MNLGLSQTVLMILFSQQISITDVQNTHHRTSVIKRPRGILRVLQMDRRMDRKILRVDRQILRVERRVLRVE